MLLAVFLVSHPYAYLHISARSNSCGISTNISFLNQGYGRPLWLVQGFFKANGGCGYVRKPRFLLETENGQKLFNPTDIRPVKTLLKVQQIHSVHNFGWKGILVSSIQVQLFWCLLRPYKFFSSCLYECILPTVRTNMQINFEGKEPVARLCTWMIRQCSSLLFLNGKGIVRQASQCEPGA